MYSDRLLRRLNTGNEYEREEALRELLAADSDEGENDDPFDVGGDDEDSDPDYVHENEVEDCEFLFVFIFYWIYTIFFQLNMRTSMKM